MRKTILLAALVPLFSGGCVAKTVWSVATAPVRVGSQVADWSTTSQEESDRNYGRRVRAEEARAGREAKARERDDKKRHRDERD